MPSRILVSRLRENKEIGQKEDIGMHWTWRSGFKSYVALRCLPWFVIMYGYLGMKNLFVGMGQGTVSVSLIKAPQNSVTGKLN